MIQSEEQYRNATKRLSELYLFDEWSEDEHDEIKQIESDLEFFESIID